MHHDIPCWRFVFAGAIVIFELMFLWWFIPAIIRQRREMNRIDREFKEFQRARKTQ